MSQTLLVPTLHFWEEAKHDKLLSTKGRETRLSARFHGLNLHGSVILYRSPYISTALGFVVPSSSEAYPAPRVCCTLNIRPSTLPLDKCTR